MLCTMCMHATTNEELWLCGCGERSCRHVDICPQCSSHRKANTPNKEYLRQISDTSFCPICTSPLELVCRKDDEPCPLFYICWDCRFITQAGQGEVKLYQPKKKSD